MRYMGLNEIRETFLSFFESKGHLRLPSFPLVPKDDESLLLINSGMAPMKRFFTGEVTPPSKRVTTCQKCIRTLDIDNVGKTARHGSYFEMLGNFSFGDYFKKEIIPWAWELCTEVLEIPTELLWISIYLDDDEAFDIWTKDVGVDPSRIVRLGKEDNFWEHGTGPCGPCSEIHFDRGEKYGCGSPDCGVGCECDRYIEFWNLVFTQFNSDGEGNYTPLKSPNIDTGLGLERLACMMQGVNNLFEVDTVQNIIKHVGRIAGVNYGDNEKSDVSLRVIGDHMRAVTFMLGDGVMPSNEGRGYVARRLLRRAARHGRLLGVKKPFLSEICDTVIEENKHAYPEIQEKSVFIKKLILVEEESFGKTIDSGLAMLQDMLSSLKGNTLAGEDAFKLYDTYGFPLDLTRDILEEKGIDIDEDDFNKRMKEQRERARAARKDAGADAWAQDSLVTDSLEPSEFIGYQTLTHHDKGVISKEDGLVEHLLEGEEGVLIFSKTPFYPEGGGQAGDIGVIYNENGVFKVNNTVKSHKDIIFHIGKVEKGMIDSQSELTLAVDKTNRLSTMRNHTAAHLLQAALRSVLGEHVEQAGQLVNSNRMRFDFTHFSALTDIETKKVEDLINSWVLSGLDVAVNEMPMDEAKKLGVMALFGEKYGDVVRAVTIESDVENGEKPFVSAELCGGTHVDNTSKLGLFRIVSESSVAAGIRRIEAVTGSNVLSLIKHQHETLLETASIIKSGSVEDITRRAKQLTDEFKELQKERDNLLAKEAAGKAENVLDNMKEIKGVLLASASFEGVGGDELRTMSDRLKDKAPANSVILLAGVADGKVSLCAYCTQESIKLGAHAGNIVKEVAQICEGRGGGRPDFAMAGGKNPDKVTEALAEAVNIIEKMVK